MPKILFFDTETTGTDSKIHCFHQIAGIIDINGEVKERFNFNVRPDKDAEIDSSALSVSKVTKEQINEYPDIPTVHRNFTELLDKYVNKFDRTDKFFLSGFNVTFDVQFLRRFFNVAYDNYFGSYFWSNPLDIMDLATFFSMDLRNRMQNFKLHTVAKHFGENIDENKLHDAMYDIELTRNIYINISKLLK